MSMEFAILVGYHITEALDAEFKRSTGRCYGLNNSALPHSVPIVKATRWLVKEAAIFIRRPVCEIILFVFLSGRI